MKSQMVLVPEKVAHPLDLPKTTGFVFDLPEDSLLRSDLKIEPYIDGILFDSFLSYLKNYPVLKLQLLAALRSDKNSEWLAKANASDTIFFQIDNMLWKGIEIERVENSAEEITKEISEKIVEAIKEKIEKKGVNISLVLISKNRDPVVEITM